MTTIPRTPFEGELFGCGHPKTAENCYHVPSKGYPYCLFCQRMRAVTQAIDRRINRQRRASLKIERLTIGEKVCRRMI